MNKVQKILDASKLDEMVLDAVRTFLTVSISVALGLGIPLLDITGGEISVALGLGIPLLDITGGDFRTVLSAGLASGLAVLVKALDPSQSDYGIGGKK